MFDCLYLLPNLLHEDSPHVNLWPESVFQIVPSLDGLIAESSKGAYTYLKNFSFGDRSFRDMKVILINEHTSLKDLQFLLASTKGTWGLICDAGLPCLADPGASVVKLCQQNRIKVKALGATSSIVLALMLSGLSGQNFAFNGYLPREESLLKERLGLIEKRSAHEQSTQIFIETPYRNEKLFLFLLKNLHHKTWLCVAQNVGCADETVMTLSVSEWNKQRKKVVNNKPTVFLIQSI